MWEKKLLALKTFKDIHGHIRVPQRFIVPTDDRRWPLETHGMYLGRVLSDLRRRKDTFSQNRINALEALGVYEGVSLDDDPWRKNLLALATYGEIYGHLRVPQSFVVPAEDGLWPEETHGIKLGNVVNELCRQKDALPRNQIDALNFFGFEWIVHCENDTH
jgi:hypothetical protein